MYHGTCLEHVKGILKTGLTNPYVSRNMFTANWFPATKCKPRVVQFEADVDNIYWADWGGNIWKKAKPQEIWDEEWDRIDDDHYLIYKGKVKPKEISMVPEPERIDTLAKIEEKWSAQWD